MTQFGLGGRKAMVTGANAENASYGLTLCAETVAAAKAMSAGRRGGLIAVAVIGGSPGASGEATAGDDPVSPCGRCRQLLFEHGGGDCLVDTPLGILPMTEVLPQAFGPDQLRNGKPDS